jgi:nucleotidyltransferase substrate binding protein (TIGR01987 family)
LEKLDQFEKALKSLKEAAEMEFTEIVRDSAIKRFEYTFDLAWKSIKIFLKDIHGIVCNSPKQCFRKFFQLEYFNEEKTEQAIKMTDSRNSVVHIYLETLAMETYLKIKNDYLELLEEIHKILKNQTQE